MSQHHSSDTVIHWLIRHAARKAPDMLSERLREEWLADLETRSSSWSRLRFAVGCCWATRVIAYEYRPLVLGAACSAVASKVPMSQLHPIWGRFSSRSTTFFLVLSLHVAVFYLLFNSLSHTHAQPMPRDIDYVNVKDHRQPDSLPKPPEPSIDRVPFVDRPPDVLIPEDLPTPGKSDGEVLAEPPKAPPRVDSDAHVVHRIMGGPGTGFPDADDFYPSTSRRSGEEGIGTLQVCVDPKGRLTQAPSVVSSTGSERLDAAALKLATAGSGHYRANTEDGRAVDSCFAFRIRFQLRK
jgi:protein TonB